MKAARIPPSTSEMPIVLQMRLMASDQTNP